MGGSSVQSCSGVCDSPTPDFLPLPYVLHQKYPVIVFLLTISEIHPLISVSTTPPSGSHHHPSSLPWPSRPNSCLFVSFSMHRVQDFDKQHVITSLHPSMLFPGWGPTLTTAHGPATLAPAIYSGTWATISSLPPGLRHTDSPPGFLVVSRPPSPLCSLLGALLFASFPGQIQLILRFSA